MTTEMLCLVFPPFEGICHRKGGLGCNSSPRENFSTSTVNNIQPNFRFVRFVICGGNQLQRRIRGGESRYDNVCAENLIRERKQCQRW